MSTPNPPEFPAGTQFRVSWEMPPATVVAYEFEDRYGPGVWAKMSAEQWAALPWAPHENIGDDYELALDQYRQLAAWAESHEQPIRNVKIEHRQPPEWTEITGVPPAPPKRGPSLDVPAGGGRFA